MVNSLKNLYLILYTKYLFGTNVFTGITFFGTADLIVQHFIEKRLQFDQKHFGLIFLFY